MDIGSTDLCASALLSNFAPHPFVFEGVECASMEGLLQSFKFESVCKQVEVCKLVGKKAKFRGKKRNKAWKSHQTLWWNGVAFTRESLEFQQLLDRAFNALAENADFRKVLLATGQEILTHSTGSSDQTHTVLTEHEFCSRLMRIRAHLQSEF